MYMAAPPCFSRVASKACWAPSCSSGVICFGLLLLFDAYVCEREGGACSHKSTRIFKKCLCSHLPTCTHMYIYYTKYLAVWVHYQGRARPVVRREEGEEGHQPVEDRAGGLLLFLCVGCMYMCVEGVSEGVCLLHVYVWRRCQRGVDERKRRAIDIRDCF